jgi:TRAP-type C4-dicarboxylate transport system permease large subunit
MNLSGRAFKYWLDKEKIMPGGLGHVNVAVSMLFAGISGSSTADAAGCGRS